jgi:Oxysterol-binding protein
MNDQEKLPPTDSRLRPDQRCLEIGEYDNANSEKLRLEQRQRQVVTHFFFQVAFAFDMYYLSNFGQWHMGSPQS